MVNKIDLDFISRNWLGLVRLACMGYNRKNAIRIMRDIETEKLTFKDVEKKMIYRVSIRDSCPWRKSIVAESEFEAMRKALECFRSECGYEPSRAEDICVAPDISQFI